jgi:hypothetical protein
MMYQNSTPTRPVFCSCPGCPNDAKVKGYCNTHYQRTLRHKGDPQEHKPIAPPRGPDKWLAR